MRNHPPFTAALMIGVSLALVGQPRAGAAADPDAAKQTRLQGQRLLQGLQSIREQYQGAAKDHPQVQKALDRFAACKQAEADADHQLAAAQEEGVPEKVEAATQALTKASAASLDSWQALQGTISAVSAHDMIREAQEEIERARKQFGASTEDTVKEALAAFVKARQAEIEIQGKIAAAYEGRNQDEVRAAGATALRARTESRDRWRVLSNRGAAVRQRREAEAARNDARRITDQYAKSDDAQVKAAAEAVAKARQAEATAMDALATAQDAGQYDAQPKLWEGLRTASEATRFANAALDARNNAHQRSPTPEWIASTRETTPQAAQAEFDAYAQARTQSAAAWARVAEAAAKSPPENERVEQARDQAVLADALMGLADRRRSFAADVARYTEAAKQSGSEHLRNKADALRQAQEKLLETLKQQCELQALLRPLERKRNSIREECEQATRKAQR